MSTWNILGTTKILISANFCEGFSRAFPTRSSHNARFDTDGRSTPDVLRLCRRYRCGFALNRYPFADQRGTFGGINRHTPDSKVFGYLRKVGGHSQWLSWSTRRSSAKATMLTLYTAEIEPPGPIVITGQ